MDNLEKKLNAKLDVQMPKHAAVSISAAVQNKIYQKETNHGFFELLPIKPSWIFALLIIYGIGTWTGGQLDQLQQKQAQENQTVFLAQEWMDQ